MESFYSTARFHFYPRSPCGERQLNGAPPLTCRTFLSTLSLRRATGCFFFLCVVSLFLSTLSLRRATRQALRLTIGFIFLSTLSLRRATLQQQQLCCYKRYFYPRSPCGERPAETAKTSNADTFLSTLSLRRATAPNRRPCPRSKISIHALLAESDRVVFFFCVLYHYFYPRSPCGERLNLFSNPGSTTLISIHALLAESDASRIAAE